MDIIWHGRTCFRLKGRSATIVTDPVAKSAGYNLGRGEANLVSISRVDQTSSIDGTLFSDEVMRLDAPGYYEISGVLVTGVASQRDSGGRNVAFAFEIDGVRVVHLGLPSEPLSRSQLTELGEVDVLFLPVGNSGSLSAKMASDVMAEIDPQVVIPMEYATPASTDDDLRPIDDFLKEIGLAPEVQPQLKVTRASLPANLTVAVLEPR